MTSHALGAPATKPSAPPKIMKDAAEFLRESKSYRFTARTLARYEREAGREASEVTAMVRLPDRLHVQRSVFGGLMYYYNGKTYTVYSLPSRRRKWGEYGVLEVPPTILGLLQTSYHPGVRDFMLLLVTPDHPMWSLDWKPTGMQKLEGMDCHVVQGTTKQHGLLEFWIDAGPKPLVRRIVTPGETVTDLEWEIPADLPDRVFEFTPPPGAVQKPATTQPLTGSTAPATRAAAPQDVLPNAAAFLREAGSYRFSVQTNPGTDPATRPYRITPEVNCAVRVPDRLYLELSNGRVGDMVYCYYNGKTLTVFPSTGEEATVEPAPHTVAGLLDPKRGYSRLRLEDFLGHLTFLTSPNDPFWSLPDWKSAGVQRLAGTECYVFRTAPANGKVSEIWVQTGPKPLVRRIAGRVAMDVDWEIPAKLPDEHFEFVAPPGVKQVTTKPAPRATPTASHNEAHEAYLAALAFLEFAQQREESGLARLIAPGKEGSPQERAKLTLQRKGKLGGLIAALEAGAKLDIGEQKPGKPEDGRPVVRAFVDAVDTRTKNGQLRKNVAVLDLVRFEEGWRVEDWTLLVSEK